MSKRKQKEIKIDPSLVIIREPVMIKENQSEPLLTEINNYIRI